MKSPGVRGTQEDAASGQPAPPNAKGRSAPSPRPGCAIENLPGRPEGLTDPADRGQRGRGALVHQPPSAAPRRAPILPGTQGTRQERQAWRRGQLSTGESGAGEREAGRPRARFGRACRPRGCGASAACGRGPRSVVGRAADQTPVAQGPRASGLVRPAAPLTPHHSRAAGPAASRSRAEGRPIRGAPRSEPWDPAQSPTGRAPISPSRTVALPSRSPRPRSPAAGCRPLFSGPTVAPPPLRGPTPWSPSRSPPGATPPPAAANLPGFAPPTLAAPRPLVPPTPPT